MINKIRFFPAYFALTASYGFNRKLLQVKDAYVTDWFYYDHTSENKKVPMLITDKVSLVLISMILTPSLWPFYLIKDMSEIEIKCRKLNREDYFSSKDRYYIDYVFS